MNLVAMIRESARSFIRLCLLLASIFEACARFAAIRMRGQLMPTIRAQWLHESCLLVLRRLRIGVDKKGDFPSRGLLVSNHLSYIDILLFGGLQPCVFVSKSDVRSWPIFGTLGAMAGTIFLDRQNHSDIERVNARIREAISSGLVVVLFPEGTSTDGSDVLLFHPALFEAAIGLRENITAAHVGYEISSGSVVNDVCYWGSMTFLPHLLGLLYRGNLQGHVRFSIESRTYENRKIAAKITRQEILGLALEKISKGHETARTEPHRMGEAISLGADAHGRWKGLARLAGKFSLRICLLAVACLAARHLQAQDIDTPALLGWETYVRATEQRIAGELNDGRRFLASDFLGDSESPSVRPVLRSGQVYVRKMETRDADGREIPIKNGLVHHWLGSIFVPGIKLDSVVQWVQDYDRHFRYSKDIERSKSLSRNGPEFNFYYRIRRTGVITVYYNTYQTAIFRNNGAGRASSYSFSTRIAELDHPGTPAETEKPAGRDRGFLWRLNSSWRFEEEEGGVIIECESLSLSRSLPAALAWILRGYIESVPRESLENTLTAIREGSRAREQAGKRPPCC